MNPPEIVRNEWLRRIEAEYRSAAMTHHLCLWLIQIGAPPELIRDGLRIVKDELSHAELSARVHEAAGGTRTPELPRETLSLPHDPGAPLEASVTRACVELFCFGETIAVRLFKELREPCTILPAKRALDRILRDEVRHRDFGWDLLAWLLESPAHVLVRELVERELPQYAERIIRAYVAPSDTGKFPEEARAWGVMPVSLYRSVVVKTFPRDYAPRFKNLGFEGAWAKTLASPRVREVVAEAS